jgi:hypothetical protein
MPRKLFVAWQAQQNAVAPSEPDAAGRSIIAGVALSGAAVAAGLWLLRYRRRPVRLGKAALATAASSLLMLGCLWPWVRPESPDVPQPIPGAICSGRVEIELLDEGDTIEVVLPKDMTAKLRTDADRK